MVRIGWCTAVILVLLFAAPLQAMESAERRWTNPAYRDYPMLTEETPVPRMALSIIVCDSPDVLAGHLLEKMTGRNNSFSLQLQWPFDWGDLNGILAAAFEQVLSDDYLRYSTVTWGYSAEGYAGNATVDFTLGYLTTLTEEEEIAGRVSEILSGMIQRDMTDEAIEKAVHDWIVLHVEYDLSLTRYSAWSALFEGTAVCQGYALLAFKMVSESGIPVRIVEGTAGGGSHAWNLVRLCGSWYHLDVTWDDPITNPPDPDYLSWDYYNRTDDQLALDHVWESTAYPAASRVYAEGSCCSVPGNIDGRGIADLRDAILALRIIAGSVPLTAVCKAGDVNGDQRIGMAEAIRIMREIAGR